MLTDSFCPSEISLFLSSVVVAPVSDKNIQNNLCLARKLKHHYVLIILSDQCLV